MNHPKVTVIIPVYNVEKYLDRCVESVVNQTYQNLEIILVDDGSSDKCPEMCDAWIEKDRRVKVVHQKNSGAGFARNTGLENVTGNYVTFVDSDDYIDRTTVEKCVFKLLEDDSQIVMYGRVDVFSDGRTEKKTIKANRFFYQNEEVVEEILSGLFVNSKGYGVGVCGKMIDFDVIRTSGIRFRSERELLSEDAFFLIELFSRICSVTLLPENLYYYVQNENSFSRTFKKDFQQMNDNFLMHSVEKCKQQGYSRKVVTYLMARYHIYTLSGMKQIVMCDMSEKEKRKALKEIINNETLQSTLTSEPLSLCNNKSKLFWKFVKVRSIFVCNLMLKFKTQN